MTAFEGTAAPWDAAQLWGLLVTYHRPLALESSLERIATQRRHLDRLIVVDNGSDISAREAATRAGALYVDAGENLGPAGAIALGMEYFLAHANEHSWIVLFDDDDPPRSDDILEQLFDFAHARLRVDDRIAAVGLGGARYDPRRGLTRRVSDSELTGPVAVDYIGGNQLPMYRLSVLKQVGVFDPRLFFGFEELDYGLRARRAGFSLCVDGELWRQQREFHNRLNLPRTALRNPAHMAAWRRYYSVRNSTLIAWRYGKPLVFVPVAILGGLHSALASRMSGEPLREVMLPIRGAVAGLLGRTGRTVDPGDARKTG